VCVCVCACVCTYSTAGYCASISNNYYNVDTHTRTHAHKQCSYFNVGGEHQIGFYVKSVSVNGIASQAGIHVRGCVCVCVCVCVVVL
jgi:hypothetical protein